MTMLPSQNIPKQHLHGSYSSGYGGGCLRSDLVVGGVMAEDESRTGSVNEAGSSSKEVGQDEGHDQGWLQLGLGNSSRDNKLDQPGTRAGLVELDLFSSGMMTSSSPMEFRAPRPVSNIASGSSGYSHSFFLQQPGTSAIFPQHQRIDWAFRPIPRNFTVPFASSSLPSSSLLPPASYLGRPFEVRAGVDVAGPSSDLRVIDPPRRPHSGLWFMLQASQNQSKEPFLPQIPKSYLRIKDGRMTVRLLMKYLANKLRLDSESEIEITCRGQQLPHFLTLQQVRDNMWSPRDTVITLLPDSSTTNHIMVLHYARSA